MAAFGGIGFCCCEPCVCSFLDVFPGSGGIDTSTYSVETSAGANFYYSANRLYCEHEPDLCNDVGSATVTTARPSLAGLEMGVSALTFNNADYQSCGFVGSTYLQWGLVIGVAGGLDPLGFGNNTITLQRVVTPDLLPPFEPADCTFSLSVKDNAGSVTNDTFALDCVDFYRVHELRLKIVDEDGTGSGSYNVFGYIDGVERVSLGPVSLTLPANLEVGVYANGGGQWDNLCIAACDPAQPDVCSLCDETDIGASWLVDITLAAGFYTDATVLGECAAFDECNTGDPYTGPQLLIPDGDCSWQHCADGRAACVGDGTCAGGGPAIRLFHELVSLVDTLVLEFYSYHFDPVTGDVDRVVLARYEAPISDICGPADFTKISDATGGNYFPAGLTATRIDTSQNCLYDPTPERTLCCDDVIPDTLQVSGSFTSPPPGAGWSISTSPNEITAANGQWSGATINVDNSGDPTCSFTLNVSAYCTFSLDLSGEPFGVTWTVKVEQFDNLGVSQGFITYPATGTCDPLSLSIDAGSVATPCGDVDVTIAVSE